jgi:hypothetical protein
LPEAGKAEREALPEEVPDVIEERIAAELTNPGSEPP